MTRDNWKRSALRFLVVLVVTVVVAGAVGPYSVAAAGESPPAPPHRVYGTVQADGGAAVTGVTVEAVYDGNVVAQAQTDSTGFYDLRVGDPNPDDQGESVTIRVVGTSATDSITYESGTSTNIGFTTSGEVTSSASGSTDENGRVSLDLGSESDVSNVDFDFGAGSSGDVTVSATTTPSGGAPDIEQTFSGSKVVAYLDVQVSDSLKGKTGTVTFTVSKAKLDSLGLSADSVQVVHYHDGSWEWLETTVESETSSSVKLSASTTFSPFALAAQQQEQTTPGDGSTTTSPDDGSTTSPDDGGSPGTGDETTSPTDDSGGNGPGGGGGGGADTGGSDTTSTTATPTTTVTTQSTTQSTQSTTTSTTAAQNQAGGGDTGGSGGSSPLSTPVVVVVVALVIIIIAGLFYNTRRE